MGSIKLAMASRVNEGMSVPFCVFVFYTATSLGCDLIVNMTTSNGNAGMVPNISYRMTIE